MQEDPLIAWSYAQHVASLLARETLDITHEYHLALTSGKLIQRTSEGRDEGGRVHARIDVFIPRL
jgi:hypothetical protein